MTTLEELGPELRAWRKERMVSPSPTMRAVDWSRDVVMRMLPHRDPFLFVDGITAVDVAERAIVCRRRIDPADPVFAGHFPGVPVYPGALCLETMGQAALCIRHLVETGRSDVPDTDVPRAVRALAVHHARFVAEVRAGDELEVLGRVLHDDELTALCAGQLIRPGGEIAGIALMEVYLVDR